MRTAYSLNCIALYMIFQLFTVDLHGLCLVPQEKNLKSLLLQIRARGGTSHRIRSDQICSLACFLVPLDFCWWLAHSYLFLMFNIMLLFHLVGNHCFVLWLLFFVVMLLCIIIYEWIRIEMRTKMLPVLF